MSVRVPFLDLHLAEEADAVREAIARVIDRAWFVLGPEVEAFEQRICRGIGRAARVGVGNGTDALALILRALGIGAGDEVITTPLSAAYTALAIVMAGARPVFRRHRSRAPDARPGARPSGRSPTGPPRCCRCTCTASPRTCRRSRRCASRKGLALVEDCCQAHLATCAGQPVGTFGAAGAFSFYPTKNLGALGDGGAVITRDAALAARIARLRNGGQTDRYHHVEIGVNSRLDEMQAAILRARLPLLRARTDAAARARRAVSIAAHRRARRRCRRRSIRDTCIICFRSERASRTALQDRLRAAGIETLVHYPIAISQQPAFASPDPADCPHAVRAASEVLSLPLYPGLAAEAVTTVAEAVRKESSS